MMKSPQSSDPARVLLFGNHVGLLETRAMVLRSVGMIADIADGIHDFKCRAVHSGSRYDVVICCYTATEAECHEIIAISHQNRTAFLKLEPFLSPPELIRQALSMIGRERSGFDGDIPSA
jgi:hypothetical protein